MYETLSRYRNPTLLSKMNQASLQAARVQISPLGSEYVYRILDGAE